MKIVTVTDFWQTHLQKQLQGLKHTLSICFSAESWQPNMILDDGGDATHVMVKKHPAIFKLLKEPINQSNQQLCFQFTPQTILEKLIIKESVEELTLQGLSSADLAILENKDLFFTKRFLLAKLLVQLKKCALTL